MGLVIGSAFFNPTASLLDGLGRGLINADPQPDRRKLHESEVIRRELVVARRSPTTVLDLVEELFDQVAGSNYALAFEACGYANNSQMERMTQFGHRAASHVAAAMPPSASIKELA
jgi:hypothetical protein